MPQRDPLAHAADIIDHHETVFTRNTSFSGTLKTDGPVRIYGTFNGDIETTGALIIGQAARVGATIIAQEVGVAGTVVGNITATERLEIYAGGRVFGDVVTRALKIEDGAIFSGQSTMPQPEPDPFLLEAPTIPSYPRVSSPSNPRSDPQ